MVNTLGAQNDADEKSSLMNIRSETDLLETLENSK